MSKTKPPKFTEDDEIILSMPAPRLLKLIIKNFRSIGNEGVEIDLNDIVVLVGPNNAGKSSILRAYELVMSDGSNKSHLSADDFPNKVIGPDNFPEVELYSVVFEERVGKHWLAKNEKGENVVREKWTWKAAGILPERVGFNVEENGWDKKGRAPFGPATIANLRRPEPYPVLAFDSPEKQEKVISDLLLSAIMSRAESMKSSDEENDYQTLLAKLKGIQDKIIEESQQQINGVNEKLSQLVSRIFPNYKIDFEINTDSGLDKSITLFKTVATSLLMGPENGFMSSIDKQGSGARRTLLWSTLQYISESKAPIVEGKPVRPNLLLIDEPEICLHPNAIRQASKVLYDLPTNSNWQVMVTTHSPIFINFEEDNTTIIRVEKNEAGVVRGTTIFRPDVAKLDVDDKRRLKLLNMCDPFVAEFFFGGKVVIVEGDTEYTAFSYIKNANPEKYKDIHIIRARGKATIVSLVKILNHFKTDYSILHDSDKPWNDEGTRRTSEWTHNTNILAEIKKRPESVNVRLLCSLPNFEEAYFGTEIKKDKPYNALETLTTDEGKAQVISKLLDALIDHTAELPEKCTEWDDIDSLHQLLAAVVVLPPFVGTES